MRVSANTPDPSFLVELAAAIGWTREEATQALGEWILSSEPGRVLRASLRREARNRVGEAA
jgi:hypothetical protein